MKKIVLGIVATAMVAGAFAFAGSATKENDTCPNTPDCVCCPCTPDCQPGDPGCVCPADCQE